MLSMLADIAAFLAFALSLFLAIREFRLSRIRVKVISAHAFLGHAGKDDPAFLYSLSIVLLNRSSRPISIEAIDLEDRQYVSPMQRKNEWWRPHWEFPVCNQSICRNAAVPPPPGFPALPPYIVPPHTESRMSFLYRTANESSLLASHQAALARIPKKEGSNLDTYCIPGTLVRNSPPAPKSPYPASVSCAYPVQARLLVSGRNRDLSFSVTPLPDPISSDKFSSGYRAP